MSIGSGVYQRYLPLLDRIATRGEFFRPDVGDAG